MLCYMVVAVTVGNVLGGYRAFMTSELLKLGNKPSV